MNNNINSQHDTLLIFCAGIKFEIKVTVAYGNKVATTTTQKTNTKTTILKNFTEMCCLYYVKEKKCNNNSVLERMILSCMFIADIGLCVVEVFSIEKGETQEKWENLM